MKNICTIWLLLYPFLTLRGQEGENAPIIYDQFFQNYFLVNPSSHNSEEKFSASIGNRTLTGLFEGVNRFYADGSLRVQGKKNSRNHFLGIQALNNRDGDFFNRNRLYGRYSWYTSLTDNSALSAGISVGFVNYVFKSSLASAGGAALKPDANLGVWYIREKWKLGISYQQFLRQRLRPILQEFVLDDYVNLNGNYSVDIWERITLRVHLFYKYQQIVPFYAEVAPIFVLYDKVEVGVNYRTARGVALLAGVRSIQIHDHTFRFMASYLISTRKLSSINDGVVELSFGYYLLD